MGKIQRTKLIASIVFFLLAGFAYVSSEELWFDGYESIIKAQRDKFRDPPISQDLVIVGIDRKSYLANPRYPWPRSDHARIVNFLGDAGVERLFINNYFSQATNEKDDQEFEDALNESPMKIFILATAYTDTVGKPVAFNSAKRFVKNVKELDSSNWMNNFGQSVAMPYRIQQAGRNVKSMAAEIAGVDGSPSEWFMIDYAFDWQKIPLISAIDILEGRADASALANKTVIYGAYANDFGEQSLTPNGQRIPGTALSAVAANQLMQGRPSQAVFLPIALALVFVIILIWFVRPTIALGLSIMAIPVVFMVSIWFDSLLIYIENIPVFVIFTVSAVYHRAKIYTDRVDKARRLDQEKSRFLARASHDLRQPIHTIGLLASRLGHTNLSQMQAEFVTDIEQSVESAGSLFNSLLNLSIIESGGLRPDYRPTSLEELFADLERQNQIAVERSGINFHIVSSKKIIIADPVLLTTMLQNIVSNAIKYAPGRDILLGCRQKNDEVSIWICDRGSGIAKEELNNITNELFRSPDRADQAVPGSGLGLSIVKHLAISMSLTVQFHSEIGKGTRVVIEGLRTTDEVPKQSLKRDGPTPQQLSGMRVLLVDDDEASLKAMDDLLCKWGCEVDGHTAFPSAPKDCDIILSDFDFGNGLDLSGHSDWLLTAKRKGVPTIIISGHPPEIIASGMDLEVSAILSKPIKPAELRSVLMANKIGAAVI